MSAVGKPLSLREKNKMRTRQDLMMSALEVFNDVGLSACSVEKIIHRAGSSRGTLYGYFHGGVEEIFRDLYLELSDQLVHDATTLRDTETDPVKRICALASALFDLCSSPEKGKFFSLARPSLNVVVSLVAGSGSGAFTYLLTEDLERHYSGKASTGVIATLIVGAMREASTKVAETPSTKQHYLDGIEDIATALLKR